MVGTHIDELKGDTVRMDELVGWKDDMQLEIDVLFESCNVHAGWYEIDARSIHTNSCGRLYAYKQTNSLETSLFPNS